MRTADDAAEGLIPSIGDDGAYRRLIKDEAVWIAAAEQACHVLGLDAGGHGRLAPPSQYPVVLLPSGLAIKFFGTWRKGRDAMAVERRGLRLLGRDPTLPVPDLIGEAALDDEWSFVVMTTIEGVRLREVFGRLDTGQLVDIGRWLGRFVSRLRAIPMEAEDRTAGWRDFVRIIEWRHANLTRLLIADDVLTARLRTQVAAWMPALEDLLGDESTAVMLHGDINDNHVLGTWEAGRFAPTGVVDFNTFKIGTPSWELGLVLRAALRLDRPAFAAFTDAAGIDSTPGDFAPTSLAWALLQGPATVKDIVDIDRIEDLDELAERLFGGRGSQLRPMPRS